MSYNPYYIDEIQDYLEGLCEKNLLVKHKKTVPPATRPQRCFARFESEEHISQIKNFGGKNIVIVADYYGQRVGDIDDKKLQMTLQLRFCVKKASGTGDETNAINAALQLAEKIMFQFWNMMEKDFQQGCNELEFLQPENISWTPIDNQPWLDDYYGWDLNVPFGSYMPAHDPDDWEAEEE